MIKKIILSVSMLMIMNSAFATPQDVEQGYAYQAKKINDNLQSKAYELDKSYNFEKFSENGHIVPSLFCEEEAVKTYKNITLAKSQVCNIKYNARSIYKDEQNKELFTWRDILLFPIEKDNIPFKENEDFKLGMTKANEKILEKTEDIHLRFKGMMLYKSFQFQGFISDNHQLKK